MHLTPRTVLIIDDSPEDRELYRRYLRHDCNYTYTVLNAELGQQGFDLWQQYQPDAVLLDYYLPDLDGLSVLGRLQAAAPQTCLPVVVVSGQGSEAIAVETMKAGAQDYLVKGQINPERLHQALNNAIETAQLRNQLQQCIERERLVARIAKKLHQSLDLAEILQTTVDEVRQYLQTDRVLIFRLQPDGQGIVVTESVGAEWLSFLSQSFHDPCLNESNLEPFRQGRTTIKPDIYDGSIDPCHVKLLESLQVRANLVVPILQNNYLWGMIIAHHCTAPRQWTTPEINLLQEVATQTGIALQQAELHQQLKNELAERRQVESELVIYKAKLQCFVDSNIVGIVMADLSGNLYEANDAFLHMLGYTRSELESGALRWRELTPASWTEVDNQAVTQIRKTGSCLPFEKEYLHKDGTRVPVLIGVAMLPNFQENCFCFVLDLSDRVQLEQELNQTLQQEQAARAEAERANRIKDEFLAILSHELRSPLNPILGWTKLMQSRPFEPEETATALATIERSVKVQIQLIDDLLDIAKILRGKLSMTAEPVNLVSAIEAALETVAAAAQAKSIQLETVLSPSGRVMGDSARLQQIVWNLLSNAIKFTPDHGKVEIRLEQVGDRARIIVRDTGKGIKPDFLPHLFESFRQEDVSTTRNFGGLGLGLAIVRSLVEAHGGTIWAESPGEGQGSTFTVQFPLLTTELTLPPLDESVKLNLDLTSVRVLAVDDDLDVRELIAAIVKQAGAEVLTLSSAAEVIPALGTFRPDVLISDIGMPQLDGYTLIRTIRTLSEYQDQLPAIALTAYARQEDEQRALQEGFQQHLSKPIEPERLLQAIACTIRR
jgi:PAS domain S-box-containing protein